MWIKLNITQAIKKIEIYGSDKKINQQEHQEITWKPLSIEGKTTGQIRSIHYNKIEITTLMLYPKPEFTINWENTIIHLGTNTTSPNRPRKNFNLYSLCVLNKRKITFSLFPQSRTKHYSFSFSRLQICVSLFSLSKSLSLFMTPTCTSFI